MSSDIALSLTQGEFAALIAAREGLPPQGPWGLAVSGGPDSMALAFCAQRWFKAHEEPEGWPSAQMLTQALRLFMPFQPEPAAASGAVAFIVDHGLRSNSSAEAATVRDRLVKLGLRVEILRWDHPPIRSQLHVQARDARYRLLAEACKRHGLAHLLVAHQMEDQAETVLMRLAKGSGVDGLAGIPSKGEVDGVTIWRPFLSVPRARLVATCSEQCIDYVIDPSNVSEAYARGRLRRVMPYLEQEGLSVARLADLAARAEDARDALDAFRDEVLREAASFDSYGAARIQLDALRNVPREIALRVLISALRAVHAGAYAPERAALLRLLEALRGKEAMPPRTLHGCLCRRATSHISIVREFADISDDSPIKPGERLLWDGRWDVYMDTGFSLPESSGATFTIKPLGLQDHATLDRLAPDLRRRVPQGRTRASLPALWQGQAPVAIPHIGGEAATSGLLAKLAARKI
ncbi:MAG: tRNA lysidine(34) synthetase TilS [Bdellovibrionales bacterium]